MIKTEHQFPLRILKLQALLKRLPLHHEKSSIIKEDLTKAIAGFRGEQALEYYLQFLTKDRYFVLKDLRFPNYKDYFFQIDLLLLSQNYFLILEIKNISGTLLFDTAFNQMIRSINDTEEGFPDPILQVQRQKFQLNILLDKLNIPNVPIHTLVVISHPSTIIKSTSRDIKNSVIHAASLPKKIAELESTFSDKNLSKKELKSIRQKLIKLNQPHETDILTKYELTSNEIITGVDCPNCGIIPMERKKGFWQCLACNEKSTDAHMGALNDYSLLISNSISNSEFRRFLHIQSDSTAKRILNSLKLTQIGERKGRKYEL